MFDRILVVGGEVLSYDVLKFRRIKHTIILVELVPGHEKSFLHESELRFFTLSCSPAIRTYKNSYCMSSCFNALSSN